MDTTTNTDTAAAPTRDRSARPLLDASLAEHFAAVVNGPSQRHMHEASSGRPTIALRHDAAEGSIRKRSVVIEFPGLG